MPVLLQVLIDSEWGELEVEVPEGIHPGDEFEVTIAV